MSTVSRESEEIIPTLTARPVGTCLSCTRTREDPPRAPAFCFAPRVSASQHDEHPSCLPRSSPQRKGTLLGRAIDGVCRQSQLAKARGRSSLGTSLGAAATCAAAAHRSSSSASPLGVGVHGAHASSTGESTLSDASWNGASGCRESRDSSLGGATCFLLALQVFSFSNRH